jgi:DnaJ-class molecular chaperone
MRTPVEGKFSAMVECAYCEGTGRIDYFNSNVATHAACPKCRGAGGYLHVFEYKPFTGKKEIRSEQGSVSLADYRRKQAHS